MPIVNGAYIYEHWNKDCKYTSNNFLLTQTMSKEHLISRLLTNYYAKIKSLAPLSEFVRGNIKIVTLTS